MRDGIIYDCPNAACKTPIHTGKCSKACIERYNKEMGIKPKTNADRIRAMSDEELAELVAKYVYCGLCPLEHRCIPGECNKVVMEWLKQPAEEGAGN